MANIPHLKKAIAGVTMVAGLVLGGPQFITALQKVEGQELTVYADKLANGLPTVCSGHTDWSLRVGAAYSKADCDSIDASTALKYGLAVLKCTGHTEQQPILNQHQFDALTLFAVNVGIAGACGSRAVKLIKQGQFAAGCKAIANAPDGKPVWSYTTRRGVKVFTQGLYNRRLFERDWCLKPMPATTPQEKALA